MKKLILITTLLFISTSISFAQEKTEVRKEHFNLKNSIGVSGYDLVAYFLGTPKKGTSVHSYTYKGVIYNFSNENNKNTFVKNPSKYEPAYGGWCAYAMGLEESEKVAINPKTYKIIDNKLYFFYNKFGINTLKKWNEEGENKLKNNADKNWNKTISK